MEGKQRPERLFNVPQVMFFKLKIETHSWIIKSVWDRLTKTKRKKTQITKMRNERVDITIDLLEIKMITKEIL